MVLAVDLSSFHVSPSADCWSIYTTWQLVSLRVRGKRERKREREEREERGHTNAF
jgi:hypothetical protein